MTLKAKILAVALSAGLVSPAVASSFTADDMQRVFTQDAPMHLATLSQSEMQDTKGSFWPSIIRGTVAGGVLGGGFGYAGRGHFDPRDAAAGAATGFWMSPAGLPVRMAVTAATRGAPGLGITAQEAMAAWSGYSTHNANRIMRPSQ